MKGVSQSLRRCDPKSPAVVVLLLTSTAVLILVTLALFSPAYVASTRNLLQAAVATVRPHIAADYPSQLDNKTSPTSPTQYCDVYPDPGNLVVSVKTGATEALSKLPTQLLTSLRCVQNPLIFSDLEQTLGKHYIHDALASFSHDAMKGNADFDIYWLQQAAVAGGNDGELAAMGEIPITTDDARTNGHSAAWGLDKYKFLHMIEDAWALDPYKDWYLFIEADTYLVWPNFLRWLSMLEPREKRYFGFPVRMWEHQTSELYFAYGGSGFLLSGAAMREFVVERQGLASRWDGRISTMLYGDYVVAAALEEELGLTISDSWPSTNPEEPELVHFGPQMWCEPVITLHHMDAIHTDRLWQYEMSRGFEPLLFRDLYHSIYPDGLPDRRTDWTNLSYEGTVEIIIEKEEERVQGTDASEEACGEACKRYEKCFQYLYVSATLEDEFGKMVTTGECRLSSVFRIGQPRSIERYPDGGNRTWTSVWRNDQIAKWMQEHNDCPIGSLVWPQ